MFEGLSREEFGAFVAAVWKRQGWQTKPVEKDGKLFVRAARGDERGLLWAVAGADDVAGKQVMQFARFCAEQGVDEGAILTAGGFADDATRIARNEGVTTLDGDALADMVDRHGLADLLPEREEATEDGEERSDDGSGLAARLPDLPLSGTTVVAVLVVLGVLVAGVLVGSPLGPLDSGEEDRRFDARTFSPDHSEGTLLVSWNAEFRSSVEVDDRVYHAREGERFVVVTLRATNTAGSAVPLRQSEFLFEADGETYGYQPFEGLSGFEDRDLVAGDTYTGWTAFSVDESVTGGAIVADERAHGARNVTVQFSFDEELPVGPSA